MKVEIQSKKGLRTILSVVVDKKTIQQKMEQRLNELQKEVSLKGFRTGKVPPSVIKSQFGKSIYGEVIDKILRETSAKAIEEKKIVGYLNIFPLNFKGSCLRISKPNLTTIKSSITEKELILGLIKKSISITDIKTSSWVINSDIDNNHLISSARELGFQPLQKVKLWLSLIHI